MGSNFADVRLGDVAQFAYGKMPKKDLLGSGTYPTFSGYKYQHNYPESNCKEGDIIVVARGVGGTGDVKIVREDSYLTNLSIMIDLDQTKVDNQFFYYRFLNTGLKYLDTGSAQSQITINDLKNVVLALPTLAEQKTIANILRSLDDKIELNRQMNATLEVIAQALFKSWFVDFDPVIDNAIAANNPIPEPFQARAAARQALGDKRKPLPPEIQKQFGDRFTFNEDLGWIPEKWELSTVGDEIENTGGGTPSTTDPSYWEEGIHAFCTPKDMSMLGSIILNDTERHLTEAGVNKISSGQLPQGAVLLSSRAPIGYLAVSNVPVSINQGIIALLPNDKYSSMYLLNWVHFNMSAIKDRANGSTFLEISKKNFRPIPFLIPSTKTAVYFNEQAQNLYDKLLVNSEQITVLTKLRDTLLPKLLSGQIRIPDAETLVAEVI